MSRRTSRRPLAVMLVAALLPLALSGGCAQQFKAQKTSRNRWLYPVMLAGFVCLLLGVLGLFAMTTPAFASIMRATSLPSSTQEVLWARMEISKPTGPSEAVSESGSPLQSITATNLPTEKPTLNSTETSDTLVEADAIPTEPSGTFVEATATPGTMTMEIVDEDL